MGIFHDPARFRRALQEGARQLAFAQSRAINETLKDIQSSQRARMKGVFKIRQRGWFRYAVKIKPWANKRTLTGIISIDPPGHPASRMAITRHERPGTRTPFASRALLVPVKARTGARQTIRKNNRPESMNFEELSRRSGGSRVFRGERRTFMVRHPDGTGFIARRRRRGPHGVFEGTDLLYVFRQRTPIRGGLGFMTTAQRVFDRRYTQHFAASYRRALETARWSG